MNSVEVASFFISLNALMLVNAAAAPVLELKCAGDNLRIEGTLDRQTQ
jgi:hypothetical protein